MQAVAAPPAARAQGALGKWVNSDGGGREGGGLVVSDRGEGARGEVILASLPDTGERYLSKELWD